MNEEEEVAAATTEPTPENPITIGENQYQFADLPPDAQRLVQHMVSIDQKLDRSQFEMEQLQMGRETVYARLIRTVEIKKVS